MHKEYAGVKTRFLSPEERLILSEENEMPLVIEPQADKTVPFLQQFLHDHSQLLTTDIKRYGAVLLRGFEINTDEDFEKSVLKIQGMRGISEAFMSEEGRIHVGDLKYILHTNSIYKTGGTLYLGGFHSENYYNTDVPAYISFCCLKPSAQGGETGLINMEKVYRSLDEPLQTKLESKPFFVSKWLLSEVADRYGHSPEQLEKICQQFAIPMVGEGDDRLVLMYKPNVFAQEGSGKKALQINQFELPGLNKELRRCFMQDYQGKSWFWHRFIWQMPAFIFKSLELIYVTLASFFYSPRDFWKKIKFKFLSFKAFQQAKRNALINTDRVNQCFTQQEIKQLAQSLRNHYCSCLWQKGDILLVDNTQVVHAGMPGAGPRLIRAMICNPMIMDYSSTESGILQCKESQSESIGFYMKKGSA